MIPLVAAQIVRIENHGGWGTGFIVDGDQENHMRTIATAHHVLEGYSPNSIVLTTADGRDFQLVGERHKFLVARMNGLDASTLILVHPDFTHLPMPSVPLLTRNEIPLSVGTEIGWLGYPRVAPGQLCFFSGRLSAAMSGDQFLVDGTAIHGVSGGPAFCVTPHGPRIVGSITAYLPNLLTDEDGDRDLTLPGLSLVTHAAAHRDLEMTVEGGGRFSIINRRPSD